MSESKAATAATYTCVCQNANPLVAAKFRAFSSAGDKGKEIHLPPLGSGQLALPDDTGNIVKIETTGGGGEWQSLGCFSPINNGSTIKFDGLIVSVNGQPQVGKDCPND